jgi:hypothetical protein
MPEEKLEMSIPEAMHGIAEALNQILNGTEEDGESKNGFVLLVFPFGGEEAGCHCIVNGIPPANLIKLFRTQADRLEKNLDKVEAKVYGSDKMQ